MRVYYNYNFICTLLILDNSYLSMEYNDIKIYSVVSHISHDHLTRTFHTGNIIFKLKIVIFLYKLTLRILKKIYFNSVV
jgi:hypothetical protein